MKTEIRFVNGAVSRELAHHVQRRIQFSLDRLAHGIHRVDVSFQDENGPRGGVDQRCLIQVRLRGQQRPLVGGALAACPREASSVALRRVRARVAKRLGASRGRALR